MGIIKDLWESSQTIDTHSNNDLTSWFARWKDEHPEYVKTTKPLNPDKYKDKLPRKSRSF